MEALYRYANGCAGSLVALFAPVAPLMWCVAAFIGVDFATGVAASRAEARRDGRAWYFESREAWRTVRKLGFAIVAIAMARIVDTLPAAFRRLRVRRGDVVVSRKRLPHGRLAAAAPSAPLREGDRKRGGAR